MFKNALIAMHASMTRMRFGQANMFHNSRHCVNTNAAIEICVSRSTMEFRIHCNSLRWHLKENYPEHINHVIC